MAQLTLLFSDDLVLLESVSADDLRPQRP